MVVKLTTTMRTYLRLCCDCFVVVFAFNAKDLLLYLCCCSSPHSLGFCSDVAKIACGWMFLAARALLRLLLFALLSVTDLLQGRSWQVADIVGNRHLEIWLSWTGCCRRYGSECGSDRVRKCDQSKLAT